MSDEVERQREQILNLLHRTEGDKDFMTEHLSKGCSMDLAAPRCAKRVKLLEALLNKAQVEAVRAELERIDGYAYGTDYGDYQKQRLTELTKEDGETE